MLSVHLRDISNFWRFYFVVVRSLTLWQIALKQIKLIKYITKSTPQRRVGIGGGEDCILEYFNSRILSLCSGRIILLLLKFQRIGLQYCTMTSLIVLVLHNRKSYDILNVTMHSPCSSFVKHVKNQNLTLIYSEE